jgi:hypothetical protein
MLHSGSNRKEREGERLKIKQFKKKREKLLTEPNLD